MNKIHNHAVGIDKPLRRNPFYRCPFYLPNKICKRSLKTGYKHKTKTSNDKPASDSHPDEGESVQHFHIDFGFVPGLEYKVKNEAGPTITSIDGFNSYLIIVD